MSATSSLVTDAHREQFTREGYFILERAVPDEHLANLRDACGSFIEKIHMQMDEQGTDVIGINHRHKRYFVGLRHREDPRVTNFLFSELMAEVCKAALGDTAYLFYELFVVKAAEVGMKFGWHQDSGYVGYPHTPYLTCWIPLVDVSEENGSVYVLPRSRAPENGALIEHKIEDGTNDKIGYFGDDPGEPVVCPAGSIVAFSSLIFHRSGPNRTNTMRPVYVAQYSPEVIYKPDSNDLHAFADPIVRDGQPVKPDYMA